MTYVDCDRGIQDPAPNIVRPPLNVKNVCHCGELGKANGERDGYGGEPLAQ